MSAVCFVTQSVYQTDPRVRRKAEALVAEGYSVDVLALRSAQGERTFRLNGVNVFTLGLGKKRGSLIRYAFEYVAFFIWALFRVTARMFTARYAVIDVNTLPDFLVFAACGARLLGAKVILDMHEITPEFYMSKYRMVETSLAVRVLKGVERISFGFADRVITINEPIQDLLVGRGLPRNKSIVVMNAVDESRFAQSGESPSAVGKTVSFAMMYHGTLTPIYGLDIAIEAFAQAHTGMPGAELWILGSGTEAQALAAQVERHALGSKVRLVGQVPSTEIPAWLSKCDAGVLPIRRDVFLDFAFPNKLPEFIVSGKPVLISRLKAIRHYFSEDALAFCEPNDPSDLARQMERLYRDPRRHARLAESARREYAPMNWKVMKGRYIGLVEGLANPEAHNATPEEPKATDPAALAG